MIPTLCLPFCYSHFLFSLLEMMFNKLLVSLSLSHTHTHTHTHTLLQLPFHFQVLRHLMNGCKLCIHVWMNVENMYCTSPVCYIFAMTLLEAVVEFPSYFQIMATWMWGCTFIFGCKAITETLSLILLCNFVQFRNCGFFQIY